MQNQPEVGKETYKKATPAKRRRHPMPDYMRSALKTNGLMVVYNARPPYQRNDYIGWVTRAKLAATREKRLNQMLSELRKGGVYMNMVWKGGRNR